MTTQAWLRRARRNGADRIYGWCNTWYTDRSMDDDPAQDEYTLTAVDGDGAVYFTRVLPWEAYLDAVMFWARLNAPRLQGPRRLEGLERAAS